MIFILIVVFIFLLFNFTSIFYLEDSDYSKLDFSKPLLGGEPFHYVSENTKAILFIHGYPGSPSMYNIVREFAIENGYDVFIPRLPGFASIDKREFIKTNFSMWYKYIKDFYISKRKNYKNFYIAGNSMGGALALKLAEEFSDNNELKPDAVASIAAPVFFTSKKTIILRTIKIFVSSIPPKISRNSHPDSDGDSKWVGYDTVFPKQAYSLLTGLKGIKKDLKKITVPYYLCHAKEDKTVSFKNLKYISNRISSSDFIVRVMDLKKWKHSNHSMFIYKSIAPNLWKEIDTFFKEFEF